jgi:hypothetical protein
MDCMHEEVQWGERTAPTWWVIISDTDATTVRVRQLEGEKMAGSERLPTFETRGAKEIAVQRMERRLGSNHASMTQILGIISEFMKFGCCIIAETDLKGNAYMYRLRQPMPGGD